MSAFMLDRPSGARLEGITKRFGEVQILSGLDLTIAPRGFTVLLGPSGCGKSTILRILAGLERQTAGKVFIAGQDVSTLEPRHRDVAMVFQNYALYPTMSVARNLGFCLEARKLRRHQIAEKVAEAAATLGIADLLDRKPTQLSGGQQQRVAIGRAIVRDPALFLFDEPLSNLDARLRVKMRAELLRLHRRLGATTVFVTHDQEEAMTMADQIVVLNQGVVEQIGSPREVYRRPASLMVAQFIGSPTMNLVAGRRDGGVLETPWGGIPAEAAPAGRAVTVGFRPDDLELAEAAVPARPGLVIEGTIDLVESLGARAIVTIRSGTATLQGVVEERLLTDRREGSALRCFVPADALHLFDETSGARMNVSFGGG